MKKDYRTPQELKEMFLPELEKIYDISSLEDLMADIKEYGILNPVLLSFGQYPIDGFRRILAAIELGLEEVPVLITDMDATPENRVALNQHRELTWKDLRNVFLITFKDFGTRQGQRLADTGKFDRYVEIAKRTKYRFKDPKTLKDVEWILENDTDDFPMSRWLFEKSADVKSVLKFMKTSSTDDHLDIYERVKKMELSPKEAVAEIEMREKKNGGSVKTFSLPKQQTHVAEIHSGEPEDLLVNLEKNSIGVLFYEPEKFVISDEMVNSVGNTVKGQTPAAYAMKAVYPLIPFEDRIKEGHSVIISVNEAYHNGFALRIPENIISTVEKETGLVYKQTLFQSDKQSFTERKSGKNLPDTVTHLLWFVKSKDKEVFHNPRLLIEDNQGNASGDKPLSLAYKTCSNHLNSQAISDLIFKEEIPKIKAEKGNSKKVADQPLKNTAAIIPIYMTTDEGDLVVDLSMKRDVESAAILMNRRFIGIAKSKKAYDAASKKIGVAIDSYDNDMVERVFRRNKNSNLASKRKTKQAA